MLESATLEWDINRIELTEYQHRNRALPVILPTA